MKIENNGGPIYPIIKADALGENRVIWDGISLRDYFAAKALHAIQQDWCRSLNDGEIESVDFECIADQAFEIADAMLKAREQ